MILDLFGGKIIQTAEVRKGEFGTGKEVKLVTEALLGQVVAHIAEVILGYCIEGPFFPFGILHETTVSRFDGGFLSNDDRTGDMR
jgi:hypothetical protein